MTNNVRTVTTVTQWLMPPEWGWQALILPQMDQGTIQIDFSQPKFGIPASQGNSTAVVSPNEQYLRTNIPAYICPSAQGLPGMRPGTGVSANWAYSTYRGCMGAFDTNPKTNPDPNPTNPNIPRVPNGMLYSNSAVKFSDIRDGTTNTIVLGDSLYGFWADSLSCCVRVWDDVDHPDLWDAYWTFTPNPQPTNILLIPPTTNVIQQYFSFGSGHGSNIAIFGMADGSTKQISKTIDKNVFKAISTRNGALRAYAPGMNIENVTDTW